MDPLSISASVVSITTAALQSARFLLKIIDDIKDAPCTIKDISADLRVVEPVLRELSANIQDDSSHFIQSSQVEAAIENCDRACKAFQSQVERWMNTPKRIRSFGFRGGRLDYLGPTGSRTSKGNSMTARVL
jgi:hypothetical protein